MDLELQLGNLKCFLVVLGFYGSVYLHWLMMRLVYFMLKCFLSDVGVWRGDHVLLLIVFVLLVKVCGLLLFSLDEVFCPRLNLSVFFFIEFVAEESHDSV